MVCKCIAKCIFTCIRLGRKFITFITLSKTERFDSCFPVKSLSIILLKEIFRCDGSVGRSICLFVPRDPYDRMMW